MTTLGKRWSRLSPEVSQAVVARYCQDTTAAVVATEFGITRNTVLRHVHRHAPECIRRRGPKRGPRKQLR